MKSTILPLILLLGFTACSRKEISKDNDSVDKASTYALLEERQRVIRYNCQNVVTSDRVETVRAPLEHMTIKPNVLLGLYSSAFKNVTMNTTAGSIVNHTDFTIDFNPGTLNLEVREGINQIHYQFLYCDELKVIEGGGTTCASAPVERESGDVFINVTYELRNLEGFSEIKPSLESCQNSGKPGKN